MRNTAREILDELLVQRAQAGSAEAVEALLERWQERLWQHARRLAGDEDAAWDILQEALMQMTRSLGKLRRVEAFGPWAYRITSGKAKDYLRARHREHELMNAFASEIEDYSVTNALQIRSMQEAVEKLDGPDQALLALKYTEGYSVDDIAAIMDVPPGTVKSRLFAARRRLKELLKEEEK